MSPSPEESNLPQVSEQTQENLEIDSSRGGSLSIPDSTRESKIPSQGQDLSNFDDFMQKTINLKNQGLDMTDMVKNYGEISIIEERRQQEAVKREEFVKDKKSDRFWRNGFNGFKILMGVAAFSSGVYFANTSSSSIFGALANNNNRQNIYQIVAFIGGMATVTTFEMLVKPKTRNKN